MTHKPQQTFDEALDHARALFSQIHQLEVRTHRFLHEALAYIYSLQRKIETNNGLKVRFYNVLRAKGIRKGTNDALSLVKMTYCANLPPIGSQERKKKLDKASSYAGLINRASRANIDPSDFCEFARRNGIRSSSPKANTDATVLGKQTASLASVVARGTQVSFKDEATYQEFCEAIRDSTKNIVCFMNVSREKPTVFGVKTVPKGNLRPLPFRRISAGKWVWSPHPS